MVDRLSLEDAQVGDAIGPYRYTVTPEMAAYAASKGDITGARFSADSSFAPSTLTDNDYSLAFLQKYHPGEAIHTKAENHYLNPPIVGKELTVTGAVSDKFEKRGKDFLVFETATRDEDGREIVKSKNTLLLSL